MTTRQRIQNLVPDRFRLVYEQRSRTPSLVVDPLDVSTHIARTTKQKTVGSCPHLAFQPLPAGKDGELLVGLRRFVEGSELSLTRIATLMGLSPSALKNWIEGTTNLRPGRILEIEQFLRCHPWRDEWHTPAANLAVKH
jgi:hypothetical protein